MKKLEKEKLAWLAEQKRLGISLPFFYKNMTIKENGLMSFDGKMSLNEHIFTEIENGKTVYWDGEDLFLKDKETK